MPVVTLGDLKGTPAGVEQGKIAAGVVSLEECDDDRGCLLDRELSGVKNGGKRKQVSGEAQLGFVEGLAKQSIKGEDGDGDYRVEHGDHTDADDDGGVKMEKKEKKNKKRQKLENSEKGGAGGTAHDTLTPGQVVALHWAGQGIMADAARAGHAVGGKERREDDRASRGAGARELEGGDVKVGMSSSAGQLTGRLRNGKKRDIGRRLGDA